MIRHYRKGGTSFIIRAVLWGLAFMQSFSLGNVHAQEVNNNAKLQPVQAARFAIDAKQQNDFYLTQLNRLIEKQLRHLRRALKLSEAQVELLRKSVIKQAENLAQRRAPRRVSFTSSQLNSLPKEIKDLLFTNVKKIVGEAQLADFYADEELRKSLTDKTAQKGLLFALDRMLALSSWQRDEMEKMLKELWRDDWSQPALFLAYNSSIYSAQSMAHQIPRRDLMNILRPVQLKVLNDENPNFSNLSLLFHAQDELGFAGIINGQLFIHRKNLEGREFLILKQVDGERDWENKLQKRYQLQFRLKIEELSNTFNLDAKQKSILEIASKGAVLELVRITSGVLAETRRKPQLAIEDVQIRQVLNCDPVVQIDEEPRWIKGVNKVLDSSQKKQYERCLAERSHLVHEAKVMALVMNLAPSLDLSGKQHQDLVDMLIKTMRFSKSNSIRDHYVNLLKVPKAKILEILEEQQWGLIQKKVRDFEKAVQGG